MALWPLAKEVAAVPLSMWMISMFLLGLLGLILCGLFLQACERI